MQKETSGVEEGAQGCASRHCHLVLTLLRDHDEINAL